MLAHSINPDLHIVQEALLPLHYIAFYLHFVSYSVDPRERNAVVTPLVLQPHLQQAHIHRHCSPSSSHYVTHAKSGEKREQKTRKGKERRLERERNELQHQQHKGRESKHVHVPPLTDEERLQANIVIEKQRYIPTRGSFFL